MTKNTERGFAIGMMLLVIALIAAITVAISKSGVDISNQTSVEKANGYALAVKSHGSNIRNTILNMVRNGNAISDINRSDACSGSKCLKAKFGNQMLPRETFSNAETVNYGFTSWVSNQSASFRDYPMDVYFLKEPIKERVCLRIESLNQSQPVSDNDILEGGSFDVDDSTLSANFFGNWNPSRIDGCFKMKQNDDTFLYYYYIVIGKKW